MLLRSTLSPFLRGIRPRHFHSSRTLYDATHYETLQIPIDAPAADVKKSFYALSKVHHPDRNPDDPTASSRFVKISEAYRVLGSAELRNKYDRENLPRQQVEYPVQPQRGSYSSTNPAGGRPASGLSRRRTTFHGPPPSFYQSGGWGAHSDKRRAGAEETASNAKAHTDHHNDAGPSAGYSDAYDRGKAAGMGPGQSPFGGNDVPHFDKEGHFRTHTNHEERRKKRARRGSEGDLTLPPGLLGNFFLVGGVVVFATFVPAFFLERFGRTNKQDTRSIVQR